MLYIDLLIFILYFRFINNNSNSEKNYLVNRVDDPSHRSWSGYAFEQVCLSHEDAIRKAGIWSKYLYKRMSLGN